MRRHSHVATARLPRYRRSKPMVAERIAELIAQVRFCEAESVILVGHSHFFREMLRNCVHPDDCVRRHTRTLPFLRESGQLRGIASA